MSKPSFKDISRSLLEGGTNNNHINDAVRYVLDAKSGSQPDLSLTQRSVHIVVANTDPNASLKSYAAASAFLLALDKKGEAKEISPEMGARLIDAIGSAIGAEREAGNDIMKEIPVDGVSKETTDHLLKIMDDRSLEFSAEDRERFTAFSHTALSLGESEPLLSPFPKVENEHLAKADEAISKAFNYDHGSDENDIVSSAIAGLGFKSEDEALRIAAARIYADEDGIGIPHDAGDIGVRIISDIAMQKRAGHALDILEGKSENIESPLKTAIEEALDGKSVKDPSFIASLQKEFSGDFSSLSAHDSIDIRSDIGSGDNLPDGSPDLIRENVRNFVSNNDVFEKSSDISSSEKVLLNKVHMQNENVLSI